MTLKKLYHSTALALLPSTEDFARKFEGLVAKLDTVTVHIEGYLEEKAVALAHNSMKHRTARQRLYAIFNVVDHVAAKLFDTVSAAFQRREMAIIADISSLRAKLDKASEARDAVAKLIGQ